MLQTKMYVDFITIKGVRSIDDFILECSFSNRIMAYHISYMYIAKNKFYPFRNGTLTYININILISAYSCLQSCFQIP